MGKRGGKGTLTGNMTAGTITTAGQVDVIQSIHAGFDHRQQSFTGRADQLDRRTGRQCSSTKLGNSNRDQQ